MNPIVFREIGAAIATALLIYGGFILRAGKMPSRSGGWITRRENPIIFRVGLCFLAGAILLGVLAALGILAPAQPVL